jgi:hypothetical protein
MARKVASAFLFAALATTPLGARTTTLGPPESVKFLYQQGRYTEARAKSGDRTNRTYRTDRTHSVQPSYRSYGSYRSYLFPTRAV